MWQCMVVKSHVLGKYQLKISLFFFQLTNHRMIWGWRGPLEMMIQPKSSAKAAPSRAGCRGSHPGFCISRDYPVSLGILFQCSDLPFPFNFVLSILYWYFFLVGIVFAPIEYSHNHKPSLMVTKCYLFMFICFFIGFYSICFLWHVSFPATKTGISRT